MTLLAYSIWQLSIEWAVIAKLNLCGRVTALRVLQYVRSVRAGSQLYGPFNFIESTRDAKPLELGPWPGETLLKSGWHSKNPPQ